MKDDAETRLLQQSQQFQEQLLDLTHDAIYVIDQDDRITLWNNAAERQFGWNSAEARGQVAHELLGTTLPRPRSEIKSAMRVSGAWEGELSHRTRDGRTVVLQSRWTLAPAALGNQHGTVVVGRDITELRAIEKVLNQTRAELDQQVRERLAELSGANEAFLESQDRFRQMAENIRDVFWLTDPTRTVIIYVNPAYEVIWGRPCLDLYHDPRSWFEAVHAEDRAQLRQIIEKPVAGQSYEHSYRVVQPDGSVRWVLDREFPVRDDAGRFYRLVGIVRDITAQKELQKEILEISEREQRRIGQDLHDDLCQQLVGIEMLSKALERQLKEGRQAVQAREIADLIRSAIDHTRVLARGLAPFDLEADGLMKGLKILAERTSDLFRVDCSFHCPDPILIHDPAVGTNLYRIAQEAVTNSIKHGKARKIEISLRSEGELASLQVKDDGSGFHKPPGDSRGMGLRIMQHRVDTIGGTFVIEGETGAGTLLSCRLHLGAAGAKAAPAK